ncbi:unnamed protein product [Lampetra planeri]
MMRLRAACSVALALSLLLVGGCGGASGRGLLPVGGNRPLPQLAVQSGSALDRLLQRISDRLVKKRHFDEFVGLMGRRSDESPDEFYGLMGRSADIEQALSQSNGKASKWEDGSLHLPM